MSMKQLIAALRSGRQADVDRTTVIVSRQACEEAADALEAKMDKDPDDRRDDMPIEIKAWHSTPTLDHIGSWARTRYPEFTVTYVRKDSIAEQVPAVEVKCLPWDGGPPETYQFAEPAVGISYDVSAAGSVFVVTRTTIFESTQIARLGSMDAAKAAAQGDFDKLILANIDARSVAQVQAEVLSAAAKGSAQFHGCNGSCVYEFIPDAALDALADFERQVREDERESCAKIADKYRERAEARANVTRGVGKAEATKGHEGQASAGVSIAAAIRARKGGDA